MINIPLIAVAFFVCVGSKGGIPDALSIFSCFVQFDNSPLYGKKTGIKTLTVQRRQIF